MRRSVTLESVCGTHSISPEEPTERRVKIWSDADVLKRARIASCNSPIVSHLESMSCLGCSSRRAWIQTSRTYVSRLARGKINSVGSWVSDTNDILWANVEVRQITAADRIMEKPTGLCSIFAASLRESRLLLLVAQLPMIVLLFRLFSPRSYFIEIGIIRIRVSKLRFCRLLHQICLGRP